MGGYVVNFTVYTLAMLGLIFFAVFIYKKVTDGSIGRNNSQFLSVEQSLNLNPRKTLHVVRAGNEKFLIASDVDRTTLISKLNDGSAIETKAFPTKPESQNFGRLIDDIYAQNISKETAPEMEIEPSVNNKIQLEHVDFNRIPKTSNRKLRPTKGMDSKVLDISLPARNQKNISPMQEMARRINEL